MRSLLAVSTPRSRGEVMSARIDVPATKQPAQPRPIRKKNGVISGEAPVSSRAERADRADAEAEQARAAAADAVGQQADGIGEREHADEVRGHQQLHLPVGPAVVAELDRGDRHHADHRGLAERGRGDRGARRPEAHQLAARPRRGRLGDRRQLAVPAARGRRRRRADRGACARSARGDDAEQGDRQERPRGAHDAERRRASARGDRDQRADHRADRARGRDGADAASAQRSAGRGRRPPRDPASTGPGRCRRSPCRRRTAHSCRPRSRGRR